MTQLALPRGALLALPVQRAACAVHKLACAHSRVCALPSGMRTTQQDYDDHAAACSRAAEQTDDPVFRRILLMLELQWKLAAQQEISVGRVAEMKMLDKTKQSDRAPNPNEKPETCYCSALPKGSGLCLPCYTRWLAGRRS